MKKKQTLLLLICLTLIGFAIRIYKVDKLPAILNRDEAALAYNALLLKETGKDEWQRSWPFALESFGDYKLPGYPYLLLIFFQFLPYTDLIVRLPSILAGSLLIFCSYYFARAFDLKKKSALLFSLLILFTPVFFFYSRMAWEANVALLLTVIMFTLILKAKNKYLDLLAALLTLLIVFTYNSPLLILPFIIIAIPPLRGIKKAKKWLFISTALSFVFLFATYKLLPLSSQKSGITIFNDETITVNYPAYRANFPSALQAIFGNKYIYWLKIINRNFYKSFSFNFLVENGGSHPWHIIPGHGHLFYLTYYFALLGFFYFFYRSLVFITGLIKKKRNLASLKIIKKAFTANKKTFLLVYLLVISLLPSIITVDSPHATRSLLFFYLFSLIAIKTIEKLKPSRLIFFILGLVLLFEISWYYKDYFFKYPNHQYSFKPGFEETIKEVEKEYSDKEVAIVDSGYQYIVLAWYLKIKPELYFSTVVRQQADKIGLKYGERVTHYHFIGREDDRSSEEVLLLKWNDRIWKRK
ncbi:MAG: glycosyltransferase family 39 protein [Candidatus Woesebacteria bacterium]|jgi:4-amino-4-deoxy-L-arabinose transferase-like glycosyltransferase